MKAKTHAKSEAFGSELTGYEDCPKVSVMWGLLIETSALSADKMEKETVGTSNSWYIGFWFLVFFPPVESVNFFSVSCDQGQGSTELQDTLSLWYCVPPYQAYGKSCSTPLSDKKWGPSDRKGSYLVISALSRLYKTEPWDNPDQQWGGTFENGEFEQVENSRKGIPKEELKLSSTWGYASLETETFSFQHCPLR